MKNFISVNDVSDIDALVEKALAYKADPYKHKQLGSKQTHWLTVPQSKHATRLSTQIAAQNLGMEAIVFNVGQEGWALGV